MSTIATALKTARQVHFLLDLEFTGLSLRLAAADLNVPSSGDDRRYEGVITKTLEVGPRLDLRTFRYGATSISIELANLDRFQDFEPVRRLDGGIGTVRVWCEGLTWQQIETEGILFKGVFQKQQHTKTAYSFDLVDLARVKLDALPPQKIDSDTWPSATVTLFGQAGQIVFGDCPPVIPTPCVGADVGGHWYYLVTYGLSKTREAQFEAGTELVKDSTGATIDVLNYTYFEMTDNLGSPCQCLEFANVNSVPAYCSVQGIRDGSGEFTGTAAGLIEHPADMVRFILNKYSQFLPEDVDTASFKTMKAVLPGIKFGSIINDSARGVDIVDRLLSQCLAVRHMRPGGLIGVWTYDPQAPIVGRVIRDHDIIGDVRFTKTPEDFIVNDLLVKYGFNPYTKAWESSLTYDRTNDPRCKQSYYQYGAQPRFEWLLTDVAYGREATAAALAQRFLYLRAFRLDMVEFDVPWFTGFDILPGDGGLLTLEEGPSMDGTGWSGELCILLERIFKPTCVRQKWMRVSSE